MSPRSVGTRSKRQPRDSDLRAGDVGRVFVLVEAAVEVGAALVARVPFAEHGHQVVGVGLAEACLVVRARGHRVLGARGVAEKPALERVPALDLVARVPVRAGDGLVLAVVAGAAAQEDRRAVVGARQDDGDVARLDACGGAPAQPVGQHDRIRAGRDPVDARLDPHAQGRGLRMERCRELGDADLVR